MSFSKVIVMATTIAAIMLIFSTATTSARTLNDGGGETKKIEDMNLIPAPEGERGMKGYWNKWKLAVEGFHIHFPHPHIAHLHIPITIPIPIPFPFPFHIHDHHLDQPSTPPSAQPPAYILN